MASNGEENEVPPKDMNEQVEEGPKESTGKRPSVEASVEHQSEEVTATTKRQRNDGEQESLDLAETLGYKAGDRFEVQWEIHEQSNDEASSEVPKTRWWGATLLEHDGRTEDSVAIRVLDYDPYPEGGFPERSQEDVIFLGKTTLVNPVSQDELTYRQEGSDTTIWLRRGQVEDVVNETLKNALQNNSRAWGSMSQAQQALVAGAVAEKKEKLVDLLLNHCPDGGVITSSDMQSILSRTMEE